MPQIRNLLWNLFNLKLSSERRFSIIEDTQIRPCIIVDSKSSLCIFDRGILDPIVYLHISVGKQYSETVLQQKQIWNIVER